MTPIALFMTTDCPPVGRCAVTAAHASPAPAPGVIMGVLTLRIDVCPTRADDNGRSDGFVRRAIAGTAGGVRTPGESGRCARKGFHFAKTRRENREIIVKFRADARDRAQPARHRAGMTAECACAAIRRAKPDRLRVCGGGPAEPAGGAPGCSVPWIVRSGLARGLEEYGTAACAAERSPGAWTRFVPRGSRTVWLQFELLGLETGPGDERGAMVAPASSAVAVSDPLRGPLRAEADSAAQTRVRSNRGVQGDARRSRPTGGRRSARSAAGGTSVSSRVRRYGGLAHHKRSSTVAGWGLGGALRLWAGD